MNEEMYKERVNALIKEVRKNIRNKCRMTAAARMRKIAQIKAEHDGCGYREALDAVKGYFADYSS